MASPAGAAGRNISNSDCPIKSGNDTKGIKPDNDNKGSKSDKEIKGSKPDNNAKGNTLSCTPPSSSHKRHSFSAILELAPLSFLSLPGILFLCHYPAWPDNPHRKASFSPSSVISPPDMASPAGAAGRNISNSDCPIKSGNDTKGIKPDKDIKGSKSDNNAKESQ